MPNYFALCLKLYNIVYQLCLSKTERKYFLKVDTKKYNYASCKTDYYSHKN